MSLMMPMKSPMLKPKLIFADSFNHGRSKTLWIMVDIRSDSPAFLQVLVLRGFEAVLGCVRLSATPRGCAA